MLKAHICVLFWRLFPCVFYGALPECILGESGPREHPRMSVWITQACVIGAWRVPGGVLVITLGRLWPQIRKRIQTTTLQAFLFDRMSAPSASLFGDLFSAFF